MVAAFDVASGTSSRTAVEGVIESQSSGSMTRATAFLDQSGIL